MARKRWMATYYPNGELLGVFPMKSKSAKRYEAEWRAQEVDLAPHHRITKFVPVTEEVAERMRFEQYIREKKLKLGV